MTSFCNAIVFVICIDGRLSSSVCTGKGTKASEALGPWTLLSEVEDDAIQDFFYGLYFMLSFVDGRRKERCSSSRRHCWVSSGNFYTRSKCAKLRGTSWVLLECTY